jgi:hypothetical protein
MLLLKIWVSQPGIGMPVTLAAGEEKIRRILVESQPRQ